jgi:hypothetical protein
MLNHFIAFTKNILLEKKRNPAAGCVTHINTCLASITARQRPKLVGKRHNKHKVKGRPMRNLTL